MTHVLSSCFLVSSVSLIIN